MLLGVVSDTHNNLKNIETIISLFNDKKVSLVIHTGDIANAQSLERFSKLNTDVAMNPLSTSVCMHPAASVEGAFASKCQALTSSREHV